MTPSRSAIDGGCTPGGRRRPPRRRVALSLIGCLVLVALPGFAQDRWDVEAVGGLPVDGTVFDRLLFDAYVDLATSERAQGDWAEAERYLVRARQVAAGNAVEPEALAARELPADAIDELSAGRERLLSSFRRGARGLAAPAAAQAQAAFDCWMEQREENRQPGHIDACRWRFAAAMAAVEAALGSGLFVLLENPDGTVGSIVVRNAAGEAVLNQVGQAALIAEPAVQPGDTLTVDAVTLREVFSAALDARPEQPVTVILFFETGRTTMTAESEARVPELFAVVDRWVVPQILIAGHADRVGPTSANRHLSLRRANLLRDLLVGRGLSPDVLEITAFGEDDPLVVTDDEIAEPLNRRVEITIR